MIEKLYYTQPDTLEFTATITGVHPEGETTVLTLDRTAFYPEGGGQPADLGTIEGHPVTDVQKREGEIRHSVKTNADFTPGQTITGIVDGERRRDYMQQHTGQHIISAALVKVGGYNTVSVHLGAEYSTIEIDAASISEAHLLAVEETANSVIEQAIPVSATVIDDSEINSYPLRRPPKVKGSIRLLQIGEVDCAACGGVHVANSGEVRLIRLIGTELIRGRGRTAWKIGDRAINDYRMTGAVVSEVCDTLSAKPAEIPERVRRQEEKIRELESILKRERERVYTLAANGLIGDLEPVKGRRVVTAEFHDEDKEFLRGVGKVLAETTGVAACLTNATGDQLQWSIAIAPGSGVPLSGLREDLLPVIDGKGGGKPPLWQGVGNNPSGARSFLGAFRRMVGAE